MKRLGHLHYGRFLLSQYHHDPSFHQLIGVDKRHRALTWRQTRAVSMQSLLLCCCWSPESLADSWCRSGQPCLAAIGDHKYTACWQQTVLSWLLVSSWVDAELCRNKPRGWSPVPSRKASSKRPCWHPIQSKPINWSSPWGTCDHQKVKPMWEVYQVFTGKPCPHGCRQFTRVSRPAWLTPLEGALLILCNFLTDQHVCLHYVVLLTWMY